MKKISIDLMKYMLFASWALIILSCAKHVTLQPEKIVSIHPVFKDTSINHYTGYNLENGAAIKYDPKYTNVKKYLKDSLNSLTGLQKDHDQGRIFSLIKNKKVTKLFYIKVVPFREFGYVRMRDGGVVFYGLCKDVFVDMTNRRVYY